jgi:hypothetical protein
MNASEGYLPKPAAKAGRGVGERATAKPQVCKTVQIVAVLAA